MKVLKRTRPGASSTDGRIAENLNINACIHECFQYLHSSDVKRYTKEFQSQPHDQDQVLHTFRELLFGSYLARNAWKVRAYQKIDGKTPDWSVFGDSDDLRAIIDVVNLHADKATDDRAKTLLKQGTPAPLSADEAADSKRVYDSIKSKCITYREIVHSRNLPYIIGLFPQFNIAIDRPQVIENLHLPPNGLFLTQELGGYPNVSGLAFLSEAASVDVHDSLWLGYQFEYFPNPYARRPLEFPPGVYLNPQVLEKRAEYLKIIADLKSNQQFYIILMHALQHNRPAAVFGPLIVTLQSLLPEQIGPSEDPQGT
jgi:hypothetical protein